MGQNKKMTVGPASRPRTAKQPTGEKPKTPLDKASSLKKSIAKREGGDHSSRKAPNSPCQSTLEVGMAGKEPLGLQLEKALAPISKQGLVLVSMYLACSRCVTQRTCYVTDMFLCVNVFTCNGWCSCRVEGCGSGSYA